jgi:hypothetical protein
MPPKKRNSPGADDAAHGAKGIPQEQAITACALLIPRRASGRHHVVGLRRNPAGGKRPWLVHFNDSGEIAISERRLLRVRSFANVIEHNTVSWLMAGELALPLALAELPSQNVWRGWILASMSSLTEGAA